MKLAAFRIDPANHWHKVRNIAGNQALDQGIISQNDVLINRLGLVRLRNGCGNKNNLKICQNLIQIKKKPSFGRKPGIAQRGYRWLNLPPRPKRPTAQTAIRLNNKHGSKTFFSSDESTFVLFPRCENHHNFRGGRRYRYRDLTFLNSTKRESVFKGSSQVYKLIF